MNYYNEFDPGAAAWLEELIADGLIPQGKVDTRSIADVTANELHGFTQCHFFAGIGGWSLALQIAGWPADKPVWTGSCPCQAFSSAGKGGGTSDHRDLWPVFANLIRECRPQYVFGEQVEAAIRFGWLDRVYRDLEEETYAVGSCVLGAHSVNAPHIRQRLYWGARGLAEVSDSIGRGGRHHGDTAGDAGQVQAAGLGADGGLADSKSHGNCNRQKCARGDGADVSYGTGRLADTADNGHTAADGLREAAEPSKPAGAVGVRQSAGGGDNIRLADSGGEGLEGHRRFVEIDDQERREKEIGHTGESSRLNPWADAAWWPCRDGKYRRIQAESALLGVVDGLPCRVDIGRPESGFPLAPKQEGAAVLLKGYGNAIVPQAAAEFVRAFIG